MSVFSHTSSFLQRSFAGIAAKLVEAAVKEIHSRGKKVQATCSYAAKWLKEHEIDES